MKHRVLTIGLIATFSAGAVVGGYASGVMRGTNAERLLEGEQALDMFPAQAAKQLRAGDIEGALRTLEVRMDLRRNVLLQGPRLMVGGLDLTDSMLREIEDYQRTYPALLVRSVAQPASTVGRWEPLSSSDGLHLRIVEVVPKGALEVLGLRVGEIILSFDGNPINDGASALVGVIWSGEAFTISVQGLDGVVRTVAHTRAGA